MQPGPDPRLRLILPNLKNPSGALDLCSDAPPGHKGARKRCIGEVDRKGVIQHPRIPEGVIADPPAPQFSSSQPITWPLRRIQPLGLLTCDLIPPHPRSPATAPRHLPLAGVLLGAGADARLAIEVLGALAEGIVVREDTGSEPLVTASTVPRVRPNNPNPNMELAAELSNGVPGFPAGDR
jgi:hypothetical protein